MKNDFDENILEYYLMCCSGFDLQLSCLLFLIVYHPPRTDRVNIQNQICPLVFDYVT
jgi:hypothetical protein